jgi:hypothetical protein
MKLEILKQVFVEDKNIYNLKFSNVLVARIDGQSNNWEEEFFKTIPWPVASIWMKDTKATEVKTNEGVSWKNIQ